MKITAVILALVLLLAVASCAPGSNPLRATPGTGGKVAGFWLGLWQGFIAPFVFVVSLFQPGLNIYEVHNNGAWYNFGYLFGLMCILGGSGHQKRRKKQRQL